MTIVRPKGPAAASGGMGVLSPLPGAAASRASPPAATAVRVALLFAVYPLFHVLVRLAVSEGLEYDEAEQVLLTQSLALGYPTVAGQPPLYSWLQYGFFELFGLNVFALTSLRALLQILTQVALYRSALLIVGDRTLALLAALSLWLMPQFSVESMRKTHTVLAACLVAMLLHALLLVWGSGSVGTYLWLGTVLGLGMLAKYNFTIVAAALLLAALSVEPLRRLILDRRAWLGLGVAALLLAPHLAWLAQHLSAVTTQVGTRMEVWTERQWTIGEALQSFWSFGKDPFGYLPPVLLHLAAFGRPREAISETAEAVARLLERFWLIVFVLLTVAVIIISMHRFHAHWLQPFLVMVPVYMFLRQPSASPTRRQLVVFAVLLATAITLLMGWRLVELWAGHRLRAVSRLNAPYTELGHRIVEAGFHDKLIIADHGTVGGNLRFALPTASVITTRMAEMGAVVPPGPCLIVWDARRERETPERLLPWLAASGAPTPPASYVEARGPRADRALFRLGLIHLSECRKPGAS